MSEIKYPEIKIYWNSHLTDIANITRVLIALLNAGIPKEEIEQFQQHARLEEDNLREFCATWVALQ